MFAELLSTLPLFPGKEKDPKNPNLFQDIQLDKIFEVYGVPTKEVWPDLELFPDWKTNSHLKVIEILLHNPLLVASFYFGKKLEYIFHCVNRTPQEEGPRKNSS
jgi:hypothetical protein